MDCERDGSSFRVTDQVGSFMIQGREATCANKILEMPIELRVNSPSFYFCTTTPSNSANDYSAFFLYNKSKEVSNTTRVKQYSEQARAVFSSFKEVFWHKTLI